MSLQDLSMDELKQILAFSPECISFAALSLPILNREMYNKFEADQMLWNFLVTHLSQGSFSPNEILTKERFRETWVSRWFSSAKAVEFNFDTAGFIHKFDPQDPNNVVSRFQGKNTITVEFWLKQSAMGNWPVFFALTDHSWNCGFGFYMSNQTQNEVRFYVNSWNNNHIAWVGDCILEWRHFAATYDGNWLKLYMNGEMVAEKEMSIFTPIDYPSSNTSRITLGFGHWDCDVDFYFTLGWIAQVRVWDEVRTQQQIKANRWRKLMSGEKGLVLYFPLDGTDQNGLQDQSSADSNLVLVQTRTAAKFPIVDIPDIETLRLQSVFRNERDELQTWQ